jgi:hypothetical protein
LAQKLFTRRRRYNELSESIREHLDEKITDLMDSGITRAVLVLIFSHDRTYSARKASEGSIEAARRAGKSPAMRAHRLRAKAAPPSESGLKRVMP